MTSFRWRATATLLLLGVTWGALRVSEHRRPEELARPLQTLPQRIASWVGVDNPPLADGVLAVLKPTDYLSRRYVQGDRRLDLFVAYYAMQRAGESMHSPRNCLPGSGWEVWKHSATLVPVQPSPVPVNQYGVQKGPNRMVVLYWYQTSDRVVASEYYAKACLVWDAVARGRTSGAVVRLALPDESWAAAAGVDFAAHLIPLLQQCLPSPGRGPAPGPSTPTER